MENEVFDLVLVHHIADSSDRNYVFKANPNVLKINDIVGTNNKATSIRQLDKSLGRVIAVFKNVTADSDEYFFVCKLAGVSKITGEIYSKFEESSCEMDLTNDLVTIETDGTEVYNSLTDLNIIADRTPIGKFVAVDYEGIRMYFRRTNCGAFTITGLTKKVDEL